ncbi:MAG: oxyanion-translocating ATPase [Acidimicrobiales bacterium]|nr:oxyanion-translocating ATPase [Acidimicrobiales bacterium]
MGKTTVSAALARAAAHRGLSSLIIEVEGKSALSAMYGEPSFSYDEVTLLAEDAVTDRGAVRARTLTPDAALLEYLEQSGMSRISKRLVTSGALDMVSTAVPGIRDILVLGKVKQIERAATADLVVLDAPAAGHAISFLQSASGLADAVRLGPINAQARDVLELLADPARCQVVLVTLPEETPVNELVETAYQLEDRVGVSLGPVVVNGCYPRLPGLTADPATAADAAGTSLLTGEAAALAEASSFRRHRMALQDEQIARLADALPLPQLRLPYLFDAELGPPQLDLLATALLDGVEKLGPGDVHGHVHDGHGHGHGRDTA